MPAELHGLVEAHQHLVLYSLTPEHLRLALYMFCGRDGGEDRLGADVLERVARRPDLFAEALSQFSASLG
jgi:hypothetical protein